MALIDDLRQDPRLADASDDELLGLLAQHPQYRNLSDNALRYAVFGTLKGAKQTGNAAPGFGAGFSAGIDQLQAMGGGLMMAAGEAAGSDALYEAGQGVYQRNMDEAAENDLGYGFTDLFSDPETSALQWASYTAGNLLPMMATSIAGGGIGGVGARMLAGNVAKQAATRAGQAIGAYSASTGMAAGELMGQTEQLDTSLAHASVIGALDAFTPIRALRAMGRSDMANQAASEISDGVLSDLQRQAASGTLKAAATGSLTNLMTEASTEGLQNLIEQHAGYWAENNASLLDDLQAVDLKSMADEAAAGGLMGGAIGAPVGIRERNQARTQAQQVTIAREQAGQQGGDALDQAMAGQQAEQSAQAEQPAVPEVDPVVAAEVGNRIQLAMSELDDLQHLARGSSYQGQTRLRTIQSILSTAEKNYESGKAELASRQIARAEGYVSSLRGDLQRAGTRERPMEGQLDDSQPIAGMLGRDSAPRLPPGSGAIYADGPTADTTQYDPQARTVRRDERMAAQQQGAQRMRERATAQPAQVTDQGIVYGQGEVARRGNANTGLDQPVSDPRFTDTGASASAEANRVQQQQSAQRVAELARTRGPVETAYLPDNTPVRTRYRVVDMAELKPSNSVDGRVNPAYPQELQPRDRTNANSQVQVRNIAANLNPERLGRSNDAATGAPIIGPDGVVESGNGRTMALARAYQQNGNQAQRYRQYVAQQADAMGMDPTAIDGMAQPVLVRERVTNIDRAEFARRANESTVAGMTSYEQALADADSLTPDDLQQWNPDQSGDPLAASNRAFQRTFASRLGNNEASRYTTRDGQASPELGSRMQRAVFAKAYADSDMVEMVTEQGEAMRNLNAGLQAAAADLAMARETGSEDALTAIGTINDAVRLVRRSRRDGTPIRELVNQQDVFSEPVPPLTAELALQINTNMRSRRTLAEAFRYIGQAVRGRAESERNGALFEDTTTNRDVIDEGFRQADTEQRASEGDVSGRPVRSEPDAAEGRQAGPAQGAAEAEAITAEPLLETYTEQDIAEREQASQQAQQAENARQRDEEQRAQVDVEANDFTLTGSDRTADEAMARGQNTMFSLSAEQESAWQRAQGKRLDMSTEGRMRRAREMGYIASIEEAITAELDSNGKITRREGPKVTDARGRDKVGDGRAPAVFYHGSGDDIHAFQAGHPNRHDAGWLGHGIYVTDNPELGSAYANIKRPGTADPNVMPLVIKPRSLLRVTMDFKKSLMQASPETTLNITKRLQAEGFDGVVVTLPDRDRSLEIALFNESDIRSTQAAFDPDHADSSDLLFSFADEPAAGIGSGDNAQPPTAEAVRNALAGMKEQLGDITIIDSARDLPEMTLFTMAFRGVNPRDVKGLYEGDTLYIIAGNNDSLEQAMRTAVHEAVGHKGMRGVLGESLDPVMRSLYKNLPLHPKGREALNEVLETYTFLDPNNEADQITIAEEMVAHLLEKGHRPKAWQRAVAKIRELLRRLFPSVAWTYTDVLALGEQSREFLRRQKLEHDAERTQPIITRYSQRSGENKLFTPIQQEAEAYRRDLDRAMTSLRTAVPPIQMGRTPPVLATLGAPDLPMNITRDVARKATNGVKHNVEMDTIAQLPELLHDPVAVFRSRTQEGALAVLVDAVDADGNPILAAIHLSRQEGRQRIEINRVASVYGDKSGGGKFADMARDGLLAYVNTKKNPDLVRRSGVQFPGRGSPNQGRVSSVLTPEDIGNKDTLYSLTGNRRASLSDQFSDFTDADRSAANKIGPRTPMRSAIGEARQAWRSGQAMAYFQEKWEGTRRVIRQGMVDRYAALLELDQAAANDRDVVQNSTASSSWVLARMANAANGALHAMLHNGRVYLDPTEKVIDVKDDDSKGLGSVLGRLGSAAEIERFMGWIAGNRSARLAREGRENLFEPNEIAAMQAWNRGTTENGQSRAQLYDEVFAEFQQYRDDVLAIAEQSGIISPDQRAMWRDEFYVPFYRISEQDRTNQGPIATSGLSRQQAFKKLKGGSENLNDLLQNTMMNFHHLMEASLKNQAAMQAVDNAEAVGIASVVPESSRDTTSSTFVMRDGKKVFYQIDDPLVFKAITSLAHPGMNSTAMKAMRGFKRLFTNLTTSTPQFMIANLIRDSLQASATSDVSKNPLGNMLTGGRTLKDARTHARMMASGASFNFGHLYGDNPDELRAQLTRNMRNAKIIAGPAGVPDAVRRLWSGWNELNNFTENLNRAAIYQQTQESGKGKLYAAFESRDLIDFSAHGAWPAVRILIDIVPFLNARIQGLDKIYRSGIKPGANVVLEAFGKGQAGVSDKQAAARFWQVAGALSMATMALYAHNHDDEEYQKLEDWQKDTYWFFRVGGQGFFIPKPFEVGAIATLTERMLEQAMDDKATGKLFAQRLGHMVTDTFSFSPVPQAFQPVLDVYANYNAFTDRPIESMGMDRLSPELRRRSSTTAAAQGISNLLNSTLGAIGNPDTNPLALSPVQVDHLIQGYFGQVGAWAAAGTDTGWRMLNGESNPARRWYEYQPVRRFYKNLGDEDRYTKYGTLFYEGMREAQRAYSDVKELREMGELEKAREASTSKQAMLRLRPALNRAQARLRTVNQQMDMIRRSDLSSEEKRQRMDRLRAVKNQIQRTLGERVQEARAG